MTRIPYVGGPVHGQYRHGDPDPGDGVVEARYAGAYGRIWDRHRPVAGDPIEYTFDKSAFYRLEYLDPHGRVYVFQGISNSHAYQLMEECLP